MSRSVRDLRELICVSRLTVRDSDEDILWSDSDDDLGGNVATDKLSVLSSTESHHSSSQPPKDRHSRDIVSPDSGIGTNGRPASPVDELEASADAIPTLLVCTRPVSQPNVGGMRRKKKRKSKGLERTSHNQYLPGVGRLPSLPGSVHNLQDRPSSSSSDDVTQHKLDDSNIHLNLGEAGIRKQSNFDDMLMYLDATVVSEWLMQSNVNVTELTMWCHTGDNFIQFSHFWLSDFPDLQKQEILKLEYSIVLDQLSFAFQAGCSSGKVKHKDLLRFLDAVLREYPARLFSSKGPHLFLDHLDALTSERKSCYKRLLSDVKVSTHIKQHAQWCLAVRSFALVSIWMGVVNFYRKLAPAANLDTSSLISLSKISGIEPVYTRMEQAVRNGFPDVVNYLLHTGRISASYKDSHQRSLVFSAVMHNQAKVLEYLLKQTEAIKDINHPADAGNCPLHAAANRGDIECVKVLVKCSAINLNVTNPQCDDATPLHLATLHGYIDVVELLIKAGADVTLKMGELTPYDIAKDFGHEDILKVFEQQKKQCVYYITTQT